MGRAGRRLTAQQKVTPMKTLWRHLKDLWGSDEAATATEYAFMLAFVIMVAVGAITGVGNGVSNAFATLTAGIPTGGGS